MKEPREQRNKISRIFRKEKKCRPWYRRPLNVVGVVVLSVQKNAPRQVHHVKNIRNGEIGESM